MYIALYDRQLNHITNVKNVTCDITKRTFDLDSASFEGLVDLGENVKHAFIYTLNEDKGKMIYSGYAKRIIQEGRLVSFKNEDFKSIFDTELILDYVSVLDYPKTLKDIFTHVTNALITQNSEANNIIQIDFVIPNALDDVLWIANYDMQYLIINAKSFLKTYLAYYGYYINSYFDVASKKIKIEYKKNDTIVSIKLDDFIYTSTTTDISINKTTASLKYDNVNVREKMWVASTQEYYEGQATTNRIQVEQNEDYPNIDPNNYDFGFAVLVLWFRAGFPTIPLYYQNDVKAIVRPPDLPIRHYYLGNDNQIYESVIPIGKLILPIKAKVFEDAFFQTAQFNAVSELVNSRYNENIIITNKQVPIDLSELELYTKINVYDKNENMVQMPISEIQITGSDTKIKLGFKKTLFTEIIKTDVEPIKSKTTGIGEAGLTEGAVHSIIDNEVPLMIEAATENISASKITSDTLNVDRIPNLALSKITGLEDELNKRYNSENIRTKNTVLAAPSNANGSATFRYLVESDIPSGISFFHSQRDFANGTIITTSINYGNFQGDPFLLEIKGNSYFSGPPFDIKIQGYIYDNTIINISGISNGCNITGMVALNVDGKLTFWFPRQNYWQGFAVFCSSVNSYSTYKEGNKVLSITDGVKPAGTKEVEISSKITQNASQSVVDYKINQNKHNTALTGDTTIHNLYVTGNLTTESAKDVFIGDRIITLQSELEATAPPIYNAGFEINRGLYQKAFVVWDEENDNWLFRSGKGNGTDYTLLNVPNVDGTLATQAHVSSQVSSGINALSQSIANSYVPITRQINGYTLGSNINLPKLFSSTDYRNINTIPNDYNGFLDIKGLKQNSIIGITGEGTYSGVLGMRGWSDSSGGNAHEFALTGNGNIKHRHGETMGWSGWRTLAFVEDVNSALNLKANLDSPILVNPSRSADIDIKTHIPNKTLATTKYVSDFNGGKREYHVTAIEYAGLGADRDTNGIYYIRGTI